MFELESHMDTIEFQCTTGIKTLAVGPNAQIVNWPATDDVSLHRDLSRAFHSPIDYPQLCKAIVSGDRIVLPISASVQCLERCVLSFVSYLVEHEITPSAFDILLAESSTFSLDRLKSIFIQKSNQQRSSQDLFSQILDQLELFHAPFAKEDLAYLAADEAANPVYLHRRIVDADFVLPIAQTEKFSDIPTASLGGLVPWFCDAETCRRWNKATHQPDTIVGFSDELRWLIGPTVLLAIGTSDTLETSVKVCSNTAILNNPESQIDSQIPRGDVVVCIADQITPLSWTGFANLLSVCDRFAQGDRSKIVCVVRKLNKLHPNLLPLFNHVDDESVNLEVMKLSTPIATDLGFIAAMLSKHFVYTCQLDSVSAKEYPWESISDVDGVQSVLKTAKKPIVLKISSFEDTMLN